MMKRKSTVEFMLDTSLAPVVDMGITITQGDNVITNKSVKDQKVSHKLQGFWLHLKS